MVDERARDREGLGHPRSAQLAVTEAENAAAASAASSSGSQLGFRKYRKVPTEVGREWLAGEGRGWRLWRALGVEAATEGR